MSCRRSPFFFAMAPELPDPAFAKIVVLTPDAEAREALKHRLREAVSQGLAPEAYVRVTQLVFGPYSPFPVVSGQGPDPEASCATVAERPARSWGRARTRGTSECDWGTRCPRCVSSSDQDRLKRSGSASAGGATAPIPAHRHRRHLVREDIRTVQVVARSAGNVRLDLARIW